ncbi:hypothetical protein OQA88_9981 [Cercophora sp. LCS_1]
MVMTPIVIDELRPDEVLVEMKYSGLCHTVSGGLPHPELRAIPGHEGAGVVLPLGSAVRDKTLRVGDNVLLSFTACGDCHPCKEGRLTKCVVHPKINFRATRLSDNTTSAKLADGRPVRSQLLGQSSFARVSAVHQQSVVRWPDVEHLALYAPLGCGFQTGTGTILNILKPKSYHSVVIFGMGSVGFTALMAAAYLGVKQIIAVDRVDSRLALAQELGATDIINSSKISTSISEEGGTNHAVDTTGAPGVIEQMLECLTLGGTAASIGVPPAGATIKLDVGSFLFGDGSLVGVLEGDSYPPEFIPRLIDLHRQGEFPIGKICKVDPVDDLELAIADMKAGVTIKPVLKF